MERKFLRRLELGEHCSLEDVEQAFKCKASISHPDLGGSKEDFQQLQKDYEAAKRYARQRPVVEQSSGKKPGILLSSPASKTRVRDVSLACLGLFFTLLLAAAVGIDASQRLPQKNLSESEALVANAAGIFVFVLCVLAMLSLLVAILKHRH